MLVVLVATTCALLLLARHSCLYVVCSTDDGVILHHERNQTNCSATQATDLLVDQDWIIFQEMRKSLLLDRAALLGRE
jgi:hypothetical protein